MIVVYSILIAASLLTIGSYVNEWLKKHRQNAWDRHVAAAVALSEEAIYDRLAAERPEAVAAMTADWDLWAEEVASGE